MGSITGCPRPRPIQRGDGECAASHLAWLVVEYGGGDDAHHRGRSRHPRLLVVVAMRRRHVGLAITFGVAAIAIVAAFAVHASRSSATLEDVNLERLGHYGP